MHAHSPTRRGFLQTSAAVGTAAAAPYVITSKALGDATTPPASDRIVMGGIGVGNMGSHDQHAFFSRPDVQYVAVCDVRQDWREKAKARTDARYGTRDCTAYIDFRDLLARTDIDAVHIGTPDHWHAVMTIAACREGKDVFVQKPETLTLREGPLMVAAARRYGRVVSGGSQRVLEDYLDIAEPCWAGEVGSISSIDVGSGPPSMPCYLPAETTPPDIDWDLWLGPAPWQPYNSGRCNGNFGTNGGSWRSYSDYSGGGLTDWGAHNYGGAIFAADLRELQPTTVTYHPAEGGGTTPAYVTLAYPNGVEIHHNRPGHLQSAVPSVVHKGGGIRIVGDGSPKERKPVPLYHTSDGSGQTNIYGDFIECVKVRARPFRDIALAVNTMTALHLIAITLQVQRSLQWDAAAQQIIGDADASRLIDRARREPWML